MAEVTPPLDYRPTPAEQTSAPVPQRGVASAFALLAIAAVGFSVWWAHKLTMIHILSFHGCACGRLSRENTAAFGLLPALSMLVAHGARKAAITYALVVAGVSAAAVFVTYGILLAVYFGFLYAHGA